MLWDSDAPKSEPRPPLRDSGTIDTFFNDAVFFGMSLWICRHIIATLEFFLVFEDYKKATGTAAFEASPFNVAESTINLWKLKIPEFSESIKSGKDLVDAEVAYRSI